MFSSMVHRIACPSFSFGHFFCPFSLFSFLSLYLSSSLSSSLSLALSIFLSLFLSLALFYFVSISLCLDFYLLLTILMQETPTTTTKKTEHKTFKCINFNGTSCSLFFFHFSLFLCSYANIEHCTHLVKNNYCEFSTEENTETNKYAIFSTVIVTRRVKSQAEHRSA